MSEMAPEKLRAPVPAASSYRFWLPLRTRNRDTDQFGHVNHAAMASLFEEARVALVFSPALSSETASVDLLVASLFMTFYKELRAPGDVRIGSSVSRVGGSSFDILQAIFVGDVCFASAEATCVLLDKQTRKSSRVTDEMRWFLLPPLRD